MEQADLLRAAVAALTARDIPYMIVGSVASMGYGEPRFTLDIDIAVELEESQAASLCDAFPPDEFYVSRAAARQAAAGAGQFNVIHPASGNKIDFMVSRRDAWGREGFARRRFHEVVTGLNAFVASPEDIILGKLWYYHEGGSEKHLRDIAGILLMQGAKIDRGYITQWANKMGYAEHWQVAQSRAKQGDDESAGDADRSA